MVIFRQREDVLSEELCLSRIEDAQLGGQVENLWCNRKLSYYLLPTTENGGREREVRDTCSFTATCSLGKDLAIFRRTSGAIFGTRCPYSPRSQRMDALAEGMVISSTICAMWAIRSLWSEVYKKAGKVGYKGLTKWRFIDLPPVGITKAPQLNEATAD